MNDKEKLLYVGCLSIIALVIMSLTFLIAYKLKLNYKRDFILRNEVYRERCLIKAENDYITTWNNSCSSYNAKITAGKTKCSLEASLALYYKQSYKDAKDECTRLYPIDIK